MLALVPARVVEAVEGKFRLYFFSKQQFLVWFRYSKIHQPTIYFCIPYVLNSVREAGGAMGKKGAAQEEMYFSKQNKQMKDKLKDHLKDEIKKHEEAIKASKDLMKEIEKDK